MVIKQRKEIWSFRAAWLMAIVIFILHAINRLNNNDIPNFLSWDVFGYYSYLPFNLIYHDGFMRDQSVIQHIFDTYHPSSSYYQAFRLENGNWIPSYMMGLSVLYLPFFLIGHIWAHIGNYPADGFSYPYQMSIAFGMVLYIVAGIFILRKVLLRFFSDHITAVTLCLVVLGTNFLHESINDNLEPHAVLFTGYALLMLYLEKWYEKTSVKNSFILGLIIGLMLLIRGSEVVMIALIVLWRINNTDALKERMKFYFSHIKSILVIAAAAVIVFLPQIIHWKLVSGHFTFNNYQNAEGFDITQPNIFDFLFSFKKGILIYTPLLLFSFIGIAVMKKKMPFYFAAFLIFALLNTYLISSWLVWWGAVSFGSRYYAQSICVLTIPLAAFVDWAFMRRSVVKYITAVLLVFVVFLNLFQTWQYMHGIIDGDKMTLAYYKAVFLKTHVPENAASLLEMERDGPSSADFPLKNDYVIHTVQYCDFDSINTMMIDAAHLDSIHHLSGKYSFRLDKDFQYSPTLNIPYTFLTKKEYVWIGIKVKYFPVADLKESPASIIAHMEIHGNGRQVNKYRALDLENEKYVVGEWNYAEFYYLTPRPLSKKDNLLVYIYNRGQQPIYIDDLEIKAFEPH